jgi:hypothetical protein
LANALTNNWKQNNIKCREPVLVVKKSKSENCIKYRERGDNYTVIQWHLSILIIYRIMGSDITVLKLWSMSTKCMLKSFTHVWDNGTRSQGRKTFQFEFNTSIPNSSNRNRILVIFDTILKSILFQYWTDISWSRDGQISRAGMLTNFCLKNIIFSQIPVIYLIITPKIHLYLYICVYIRQEFHLHESNTMIFIWKCISLKIIH